MVSPGGGLFLRELVGVSMLRWNGFWSWRGSSSWGPLPPCFWRCSMICLCLSLTSMLLCSCSLMVGSWVWKPGDRQASPTSCMIVALSLELMGAAGRAVRAPEEWTMLWLERSSRRGLWREVVRSGDEGSFLTTILGAGGPRALRADFLLDMTSCLGGEAEFEAAEEEEEDEEGGRKEEVEV